MSLTRLLLACLLFGALTPAHARNRAPAPCLTAEQAAAHPNSEVCVTAHIYQILELTDGSRFLDVCPLSMADNDCRFIILSLAEDRDTVGPLLQYRDMNVHIRGIVRPMHGRMGIVLSHVRQFSGGPPRFRPNPRLLKGFNPDSNRPPIHDPALSTAGRSRSFLNNKDTVQLPDKKP